MLISLLHRTTFTYATKAQDSFNEVRLKPVDDGNQMCRSFELRTDPVTQPREYYDFYANTVHYFDIVAGHNKLVIEAVSEVETTPNSGRPAVPAVPFSSLESGTDRELHAEFLADSHYVPLDVAL
ncbi:MAG TPA: transglutaminase N-terminal domain-containing protein, partial [Opitutaceae bacterium]